MPVHSLSAAHLRQALVAVAQMGVVPEQVVLSLHCTQAPVTAHAVWPANPAQSLAAAQARQVFEAVAQIGALPEQLALVRHCTHVFVVVLHTAAAPAHLALLLAVH